MRKIKAFPEALEAQMGLNKKSEKRWFWCALILLTIYLECVVYAQNSSLGSKPHLLSLFYAVIVIPLCFVGVRFCNKIKLSSKTINSEDQINKKRSVLFIIGVFVLTFSIYFLWQTAFWPGSYSYDSINQYAQVIDGNYNNWHPVLHTWLFFWLPFRIFHGAAGIVFVQLVWFSAAVTYLFHVLHTGKCPNKFMFLSWLYIVANPNTARIMLYPWKDSAMSIFALVLFTQLIRIYMTEGKWLEKWYNLAMFSAIAFLTVSMRHNAVLLVAPVFVILFLFFKNSRKRLIISIVSVIMATFLLNGPIFKLANVGQPGMRTLETVGCPMTILSDIYIYDRSALSEESLSFMDSLATQEEWKQYVPGNFNSIKGVNDALGYKVDVAGTETILKYTVEASLNNPWVAWDAFVHLTDMVWSFDGGDGWSIGGGIIDNPYGIRNAGNEQLETVFSTYASHCNTYVTKYLFNFIGVIILLLLFMAVGKIGNGNLSEALLILAPMAYNFGTMLLLSGPDFRFFHYNFLIIVPLLYIILKERA